MQLVCQCRENIMGHKGFPAAGSHQVIACRHQILPIQNPGELAPNVRGRRNAKTIRHCALDTAQAVPDDASRARRRSRVFDGDVQDALHDARWQGNAEQSRGCLVTEVGIRRHHMQVGPAPREHILRWSKRVDGVERMMQVASAEARRAHARQACVLRGEGSSTAAGRKRCRSAHSFIVPSSSALLRPPDTSVEKFLLIATTVDEHS
ncbi:hypothetical protein LLS1_17400 [Leifsonia sp. LS1]|nr:hypothetical protein LLS1_17400 [Leifsonia sp. LS1]